VLAGGVLEAWARGELPMEGQVRSDLVHFAVLIGEDEGGGDAGGARAAVAVDVGVTVGGCVEVDQGGDVLDVDAADCVSDVG
jgi:hypothetical protein